jgi:uncharacterized repeat protein (TIGR01451 family)
MTACHRIPLFLFSSVVFASTLTITTTSVPTVTQYQSYSTTLAASGGTPPYTWSVVSSTGTSLPEGMSLNASTGLVSATQVNGQGGYAVTLQVTDHASNTATATLNFGVESDSSYGGCQMFPPDSIFNQRIDRLPVDTTPSHQIPSSYLTKPLHPDFGTGFYPGPGGIPFMRVASNQPATNVDLENGGQIDPAGIYAWPYPPWPNAVIEGTSYGQDGNDHHILILQSSVPNIIGPQTGPCTLYETYQSTAVASMFNAGTDTWSVLAGSHYVLNSDEIALSAATLDDGAQDSPGIPLVPLLIRYSEVPLGVQHPLRITFPSPTNGWVWPATGCCTGSGPPQGLLYRLKASVNWQAICPVGSNPQAATLLQALQQYGAYMSDHGSAGFMQGVPDIRWNDDDLGCIKSLTVSDLEVVDNSVLEVSDISGQTKPYIVPAALANATVGSAYTAAIAEVGGNPATVQWSVASGSLPPGLTLNASTGAIGGSPTSAAGIPYNFNLKATDTASGNASPAQAFSIAVAGASLTIAKSHTPGFKPGDNGDLYTVTVSNAAAAQATSGAVTVTETIPTGLTLASMMGTGWSCPAQTTSCTRSDSLAAGVSYPAITVTVNVALSAPSSVINQVSVSGGGSAPASATDPTNISSSYSPCDVGQFGITTVADVQKLIDEALGTASAVNDLNSDKVVNAVDVQIAINAALGLGCSL